MRNDGYLVFALFFLLLAMIFSVAEKERVETPMEEMPAIVDVPPAPPPIVRVRYEVEYGSFYTGDQTPIIHRGLKELPIVEGFGIGTNGLPIHHFAPTLSSQLPFTLKNGEDAILHISCNAPRTTGFLEFVGKEYHSFMDVEVTQDPAGISVRAAPHS